MPTLIRMMLRAGKVAVGKRSLPRHDWTIAAFSQDAGFFHFLLGFFMSRVAHSFSIVRKSVRSYSEEPSSWKIEDTEEALRCWDFEKYLEIGIVLFNAISEYDEEYRERVLAGKEEWDSAVPESVFEAYRWWHEPCGKLLGDLKHFENNYGEIENADRFRRCVREVKGILTSDADFFSGEELVKLRDEAIDLHVLGETIELGDQQQECSDKKL